MIKKTIFKYGNNALFNAAKTCVNLHYVGTSFLPIKTETCAKKAQDVSKMIYNV